MSPAIIVVAIKHKDCPIAEKGLSAWMMNVQGTSERSSRVDRLKKSGTHTVCE
jgi:hypothetical protein